MRHDPPGPRFIRYELPYPIALGWQRVVLATEPRDRADAAFFTVEIALRLVTGVQLASLLSLGEARALPPMLAQFGRPTLGSWSKLAVALARCSRADTAFVPELARWPTDHEDALRDFVRVRNAVAHGAQQHAPAAREDTLDQAVAQAASLLASLEWMRRCPLVRFADAAPREEGVFAGRVHHVVGYEALRAPRAAAWRGWPREERVYLWDGRERLLDVAPFIAWDRLRNAPARALVLWDARGDRGDVRVSDLVHGGWTFAGPLDAPRDRIVPVTIIEQADRTVDAFPATPTAPPRQATARPLFAQSPRRSAPRTTTRWWLAGAGVVAAAALTIAGVAASTDGESAPAVGVDAAPLASGACEARALAGGWSFDTEVRGAKPEFARFIGVRGHYRLSLEALRDGCALRGRLMKVGYTQEGALRGDAAGDDVRADGSPAGVTAALQAWLTRDGADGPPAEIALRLLPRGDLLYGLWRHEGADRLRAGYWGPLLGHREGAERPSDRAMTCFARCAVDCHAGRDPMLDATEPCLTRCATEAERCAR